jgi:hypothetical protein
MTTSNVVLVIWNMEIEILLFAHYFDIDNLIPSGIIGGAFKVNQGIR